MPSNRCHDTVPRQCAESFAAVRQALGQIQSVAEATHEQAARTDQQVARLFELRADDAGGLARLEVRLAHVDERQHRQDTLIRKLFAAGWRVAVALAGVVASVLGIKHLFK